jgi:tryptophan synthase alpha chain
MADLTSTAASSASPPRAAGVSAIAAAFAAARDEGRAALMPYLMGGFPDQQTATAVAEAYVDAGADLIELGVPFSDPLADGPVIHAADTAALAGGATLESVLETCAAVGDRIPVALMCYANMVLARGTAEFAAMASDAGASAVIVPDLPLEEQDEISGALAARELALVPLVAPTTPADRRAAICARARAFVYLVSTVGVTGERDELPTQLTELIAAAKEEAGVPVAVGFGISTPEQAASVGEIADGVIIGSRLVREVADAADRDAAVRGVFDFLHATRQAVGR